MANVQWHSVLLLCSSDSQQLSCGACVCLVFPPSSRRDDVLAIVAITVLIIIQLLPPRLHLVTVFSAASCSNSFSSGIELGTCSSPSSRKMSSFYASTTETATEEGGHLSPVTDDVRALLVTANVGSLFEDVGT